MFNLQPAQGLGFTGSREIALGLGGAVLAVVEEEEGSTAGLGYHAELQRRKNRDDSDLITIIMAFMQIKDE